MSGWVYIMASKRNGTIYIGVTSDLLKRVWEHRHSLVPGFTKQHGCVLLVWFEAFDDLHAGRHLYFLQTVRRFVGHRGSRHES